MGLEVAAAAAIGGGLAGGLVSSLSGAEAEEEAARKQFEAQREQRRLVLEAAAPSPQELAAQQKQIEAANRSIARQEKLIEAIDPAVIESAKQAQALLQGKEAGALAPLRQAQARERAQIESRLREQLGGGFASSSAGIEALTRLQESQFGQQQAAQERTLGQLMGFAQQARPDERTLVGLSGLEAGFQRQARLDRVQALQAVPFQADISEQIGSQARAEAFGDLFGGLTEVGTTALKGPAKGVKGG